MPRNHQYKNEMTKSTDTFQNSASKCQINHQFYLNKAKIEIIVLPGKKIEILFIYRRKGKYS